MAYVYLLSTYEEHGSDDVVATLDREKLPDMLLSYNCNDWYKNSDQTIESRWLEYKNECLPTLITLLEAPDSKLSEYSPHNLSHGWGGIQLHVVKLC